MLDSDTTPAGPYCDWPPRMLIDAPEDTPACKWPIRVWAPSAIPDPAEFWTGLATWSWPVALALLAGADPWPIMTLRGESPLLGRFDPPAGFDTALALRRALADLEGAARPYLFRIRYKRGQAFEAQHGDEQLAPAAWLDLFARELGLRPSFQVDAPPAPVETPEARRGRLLAEHDALKKRGDRSPTKALAMREGMSTQRLGVLLAEARAERGGRGKASSTRAEASKPAPDPFPRASDYAGSSPQPRPQPRP